MNKRTFVKNTAVMTATSLLLRTLGIVFRIFISGRVGAEGMGLYQLVFSVYVLGTTFASAGLSTAVTRMVAQRLVHGDRRGVGRVMRLTVVASLLVGGVSALLLYVGGPVIGGWIGDVRTVPAIRISGIALPFIGICNCLKGYFMARRKATAPSLSLVLEQVVRIGGILLLLEWGWDGSLEGACRIILLGDALSECTACLYMAVAYHRDRRKDALQASVTPGRRVLLGEMLHISLPLTAGRYLSTALRTVENILVPARLTLYTCSAAVALEQFGAIKGMALPLLFFPSAFLMTVSSLLIPELSDAHALGQQRQVARLVESAIHITLPASIWLGCLFTVLGRSLGLHLYDHHLVGLLLQILGPLTPIMYLDSVATGMLKGLGEQVHSLWYGVADSAVRILLIWLLLPRFGLTGFLFVMVVSNLLTCLLSTGRLFTVSGVKMNWGKWVIKPLLIAGLAGGGWVAVGRLLPLPGGWPEIMAGCVSITLIFLLLLPLFRCFTLSDLRPFTRHKLA